MTDGAIAEVIESSTRSFTAQVHREGEAPPFGGWVQVAPADGMRLYGLVSHVEQGSYEPGRRARALGKSTEELRREMPHVLELLCTTFRAQVVAFREEDGPVRQTLPPHPAAIHAGVYACSSDDVCGIERPYDFLRILVQQPDGAVPVDDLLVAVLRGLHEAHGPGPDGEAALVHAGRLLSRLFDDDHERLQSILRRAV